MEKMEKMEKIDKMKKYEIKPYYNSFQIEDVKRYNVVIAEYNNLYHRLNNDIDSTNREKINTEIFYQKRLLRSLKPKWLKRKIKGVK